MGTRNLTVVFMDGEYRVAQYGQWDGYPEGQGMICLHFLRDKMVRRQFIYYLDKMKYMNDDVIEEIQSSQIAKYCPEFSRDTGAEILQRIQDDRITTRCLENSLWFASDGLFCEWAYVIDLDSNTFEVYQGFNKTPLTMHDRFYFMQVANKPENGYYPVRMCASWDLDDLPTDEAFLAAFKDEDEDDE